MRWWLGMALLAGAWLLRGMLEASMVLHMFVQLPAIALAGALLASPTLLRHWRRADAYGLTSFTLLLIVSAYWMIPRALELSLTQPLAEAGKFASLLLLGAVLPDAMRRANAVIQLFFIGNFCWMGAIAGIQYQNMPQRLCNAYALDEQILAGVLLTGASAAVALAWCIRHFPSGESHEHRTL